MVNVCLCFSAQNKPKVLQNLFHAVPNNPINKTALKNYLMIVMSREFAGRNYLFLDMSTSLVIRELSGVNYLCGN